jgi:hypothetical protein
MITLLRLTAVVQFLMGVFVVARFGNVLLYTEEVTMGPDFEVAVERVLNWTTVFMGAGALLQVLGVSLLMFAVAEILDKARWESRRGIRESEREARERLIRHLEGKVEQ